MKREKITPIFDPDALSRMSRDEIAHVNYGWTVLDKTSQSYALNTRAQQTLYTGARGPGKTDTQLMRYAIRCGKGYGMYWRGIIFDREYKNLDDLVSKSKRWFNRLDNGPRWYSSKSDYKWVWPTGEELLLRAFSKADDYWNYHGQEFPYIGWNELCSHASSRPYDDMMSCNRSSWTQDKDSPRDDDGNFLLPEIPLEVFSTTNSYGPGFTWVKKRFISVAPMGDIVRTPIEVFDPATKQNVTVERTQVAIHGSYKENKYLSPKYIATLMDIKDENKRKSWLEGSWDVMAGGALGDVWDTSVHTLPVFYIPENWYVDRSFDWGSTHPFSVGWWAEANGEEVLLPDGRVFCPPRGSLIQIAEIYGADEIGNNKGIGWGARQIAHAIKEVETWLLRSRIVSGHIYAGPADNQIRNVTNKDVDTVEKIMADTGIIWTASDKSAGSRANGLQIARDRLESAKTGDGPALYFMLNCRASIETLPVLPRDPLKPDDIDTKAEDHAWDMVRYRVLAGNNRLLVNISDVVKG